MNSTKVMIRYGMQNKSVRKLCLCRAINPAIFWANITGITAISCERHHEGVCKFSVSKRWLFYTRLLQIIYGLYMVVLYGLRLICPNDHNDEAWYVMTFGYFVGDVESIFTVVYGSLQSKNICNILQKLSTSLDNKNIKKLQKNLRKLVLFILIYYITILISHIYVTFVRNVFSSDATLFSCSSIDTTLAILIRGVSKASPSGQLIITFVIAYVIGLKFKALGALTETTLRTLRLVQSHVYVLTNTTENKIISLHDLSTKHKELFHVIQDFNKSFGPQLLMALTASLYNTIYNLYRYSTSNWEYKHDTLPQKLHYLLGLGYRLLRMLLYMFIGKYVQTTSLRPLQVLQDSSIMKLSLSHQQEVQSLILLWWGKCGYLSASGVVNIGPWLLAPIIGNVVTYLLVALQFDQSQNKHRNITKVLTSFLE